MEFGEKLAYWIVSEIKNICMNKAKGKKFIPFICDRLNCTVY